MGPHGGRGARAGAAARRRVPRGEPTRAALAGSRRRLCRRRRPDPAGVPDAAAVALIALPADGAPAPERRPRRVGAGALRAWARPARRGAAHRERRAPRADASGDRASALACDVLRVARAARVRRRARAPDLAPPSRAPLVPRSGSAALVAGRAGGAAPALVRSEVPVRVRRLRPREPPRAPPRAPSENRLPLLRPGARAVGPVAPRRPAARGRDNGGRAGGRLLRSLRHLPRASSARGGGPRAVPLVLGLT